MINKKRLLAGLAIGCVLSTAAVAQESQGFYFGVWGGAGEFDFPSKSAYDRTVSESLSSDIVLLPGSATLTSVGNSDLDDSLSVWGVQVGYRFNKYVALEVGYVDLGELLYRLPGTTSGTYDISPTQTVGISGRIERATQLTSSGITGSVLGILPLGERFDLHLRGGLYSADTRVTERIRFTSSDPVQNLAHRRVDASQTELYAGAGAAWNINESFTLRVEYQKFFDVGDDEKTGEGDVDTLSLSLLFR